jgi:hypothetical protein
MLVRELIELLRALPQDQEVEMAMNMEYQSEIEAHLVREVVEDGRYYVLIGE